MLGLYRRLAPTRNAATALRHLRGRVVRPGHHLEPVDEGGQQQGIDGLKIAPPHRLDLLDDIRPVDVVHPLPRRHAAQALRLGDGPGQDVAVVEIVRHGTLRPEQ